MHRMNHCALLAAIAIFVGQPCDADHPAAGFGPGIAGPIVTIPAGTLPKGMWTIGARVEFVVFDPFTDQKLEAAALAGEDIHSTDRLLSPSLGVGYGVTPDLTVGARVPYVHRSGIREGHLELGVPEVHDHGDSKGIGDLTILGQYRFVRVPDSFAAALLAGVKLPTGETDATGQGEPFETEHQPGSGSTDPLIGLAGSMPRGNASVDANLLATLSTEGSQSTNLGTLLNYNVALSFRPGSEHEHAAGEAEEHQHGPGEAHPHEHALAHAEHHHLAFDLVLEANGEWRARMEVAGAEEENSGGTLIYVTPGVRVSQEGRWSVTGSVGIPVFQDLNGSQHDTEVRVLSGFGLAF